MVSEQDIDRLERRLTEFHSTNDAHHSEVNNMVVAFNKLLIEHRQLLSDYEEEKESRERYKRQARSQTGVPFVTVLIDGDAYLVSFTYLSFIRSYTTLAWKMTQHGPGPNSLECARPPHTALLHVRIM